jgi:hypothetical protein
VRLQSSSAVRGSRVSLDGDDAVVLGSFSFPLPISSSPSSTYAMVVDLGKNPERRQHKGKGNRVAWE